MHDHHVFLGARLAAYTATDRLAVDVSFVHFYDAWKLSKEKIDHRFANPMHHVPRGAIAMMTTMGRGAVMWSLHEGEWDSGGLPSYSREVSAGSGGLPLFANQDRNCFLVLLGYSFCYPGFQQLGTQAKEPDMAKNHYTTKPKRRNRSGKRKDTRRIAANMAKIKELERTPGRTA
jgi:hypothetical protein